MPVLKFVAVCETQLTDSLSHLIDGSVGEVTQLSVEAAMTHQTERLLSEMRSITDVRKWKLGASESHMIANTLFDICYVLYIIWY